MAVSGTRIKLVVKRKRSLIIVALVVSVAGFVLLRAPEPRYKGERVSYWVDKACRGYGKTEAYSARLEVKNIGPAAVPYLVRRLNGSDKVLALERAILMRLPEQFQFGLEDAPVPGERRIGAALTLQLLGPDAKAAVPDLIRLLPYTEVPVVETLSFIGPAAKDALPALRSSLPSTTNMSQRVRIAGALWSIGRETNFVLQICTNALAPNSGDDGINAGAFLVQLGRAAAPAVPSALALLQDTNRQEGARGNAANILGVSGISTPEILAALLNGTKPDNPQVVRCCCSQALCRFDHKYAPLATRLTLQFFVALNKSSPGNPQNLYQWIKYSGLEPGDCLPTLNEMIQDKSADIRSGAMAALETIRANDKSQAQP